MIDRETTDTLSISACGFMSYEDISYKIAENRQQLSEMLKIPNQLILCHEDLDDPTLAFQLSISSGDTLKLKELLSIPETKKLVDINAGDTPPLIYAACFGKTQMVEILLEAGADIDVQDSFGWSALMWATNNNHVILTQLLLNRGASQRVESIDQSYLYSTIGLENLKNTDSLNSISRDSMSSRASSMFPQISIASFSSTTEDEMDIPPITSKECQINCSKFAYDQVLVFKNEDLEHILDLVITDFQLPLLDLKDMHVPANVLFMTAKYSYHFSFPDELDQLLNRSFSRINNALYSSSENTHLFAFWISNLTQLLFYLKRDAELVFATIEQQLKLSELMSELYLIFVKSTEEKLLHFISLGLLEYESIPNSDQIRFADTWQRFFFRKNTAMQPTQRETSPYSITKLFSSILNVLKSYQVHTDVITQLFSQLFHFLSSESFNHIISSKKYLCRSKAIQIRMNFSQIEDWAVIHSFPSTVLNHLYPVTQLLQLLQCLSQLEGLLDFVQITQKFGLLNMLQIRRCILSYRYEINEKKVPEEIEKYTMQFVKDKAKQKLCSAVTGSLVSGASSTSLFGRNSIPILPISEELPDEESKEKTCTKFLLSFTVPTITHMFYEHHTLPSISQKWMKKLYKLQANLY